MPQLADLYDADKAMTDPVILGLRVLTTIPHPLHGVDYADGAIVCGRVSCEPCRAYKGQEPWWKVQDRYERLEQLRWGEV